MVSPGLYSSTQIAEVGFEPHDLEVMGLARTPDSSTLLYERKGIKILINLTILAILHLFGLHNRVPLCLGNDCFREIVAMPRSHNGIAPDC